MRSKPVKGSGSGIVEVKSEPLYSEIQDDAKLDHVERKHSVVFIELIIY